MRRFGEGIRGGGATGGLTRMRANGERGSARDGGIAVAHGGADAQSRNCRAYCDARGKGHSTARCAQHPLSARQVPHRSVRHCGAAIARNAKFYRDILSDQKGK